MAIWIILAAVVAVMFGFSLLPIMIVGAAAIVITAYIITRQATLLRLGLSFTLFAIGTFAIKVVLGPLLKDASSFELKILGFITSDDLMLTMSAVVILVSIMLGTSGSDRGSRHKNIFRKSADRNDLEN